MDKSTLGLIETKGFVGAVEALDVALKSANVELVSCEFVKAGIVTILITGDVASVKAAIESAATAVDRLGVLLNTHVIARADEGVWNIIQGRKKEDFQIDDKSLASKTVESLEVTNQVLEEDKEKLEESLEKIEDLKEEKTLEEVEIFEKEEVQTSEKEETLSPKTREELEALKVQELRTLARKMELKSLTKKQIKFSKKEQLIDAILKG